MKFQLANTLSMAVGLSLTLAAPASAQKPHPSLPEVAVPEALGVNIHFTDARPGELKMLADGGFRIARMDFAWSATEKTRGIYDFSEHDRLLKQLEAVHVQPLFIFDYSNPLYDEGLSPYSDAGRAAFAKWAAAAAVHFRNHNVLWEMYNEPNGFWKPKPDTQAYIKLALATGKAVKAAAPGECFIGPGLSGFDFAFFEACFKAGLLNYWDAVSVHPYRGDNPESAGTDYRRLRLMIERARPQGKTIPVLSGEWGYSTKGVSETTQAQYLARQWMTNLMNGIPVSIWYDWHNDGTDPTENEHNFGTTRFEYHENRDPVYDPKPSYIAAKTFSQFFNGYKFNKRLALPASNDYFLLFSKGSDVKMAAWTTGPPHEVTLPLSGEVKGATLLNTPLTPMQSGADGLKLSLTENPLYLEPVGKSGFLAEAAAWAVQPLEQFVTTPTLFSPAPSGLKIQIEPDSAPIELLTHLRVDKIELTQSTTLIVANPLSFKYEPGSNGNMLVSVENPSGQARLGRVTLNDSPEQRVEFKEGEQEKVLSFAPPEANQKGERQAKLVFAGDRMGDNIVSTFTTSPVLAESSLTAPNFEKTLTVQADGDATIESTQKLSLENAPEPTPGGGTVLKLDYKFAPGWKFIEVKPLTALPFHAHSLGLWVYGDNSGNQLRLRVSDNSGQTLQPDGSQINWKGWKFVTFQIGSNNGHWGGANDGQLHGASTLGTLLLLDSTNKAGSAGHIYFGAPIWITESHPPPPLNGSGWGRKK